MKAMLISEIVPIIIGFAVLTSYSGQWEVFTCKNDVRYIALSGNTLWAATGGGVVAWNLSDNSYKSYTTADGLISRNINQIVIDKKGRDKYLWCYDGMTWQKHEGEYGPLALDLQKNLLAVDSLYSALKKIEFSSTLQSFVKQMLRADNNLPDTLQFTIVSFNSLQE